MNLLAMVLGWEDMVSDLLFGLEALQYTWVPEARIIGNVSLGWLVVSCVYNHNLWKSIKDKNERDMKEVGDNNAIYAVVDILMLGSLDMMVVHPWQLDGDQLNDNQNYPDAHAVDSSIKSQAFEDMPQVVLQVVFLAAVPGSSSFVTVGSLSISVLSFVFNIFAKRNLRDAITGRGGKYRVGAAAGDA